MIITAYFFLLRPGEYSRYKSESTSFCLKDTDFSWGCSFFAATAKASYLQASNFVLLTFRTQGNGARGGRI